MKDTQKIKDELFHAWEKYHSFSTDKTNYVNSLDENLKNLLKIALIQKITLPHLTTWIIDHYEILYTDSKKCS